MSVSTKLHSKKSTKELPNDKTEVNVENKELPNDKTEVDVGKATIKKRYISPEERQQIIDELKLV